MGGTRDADIIINDKEISRWHCALEIKTHVSGGASGINDNGHFLKTTRPRAEFEKYDLRITKSMKKEKNISPNAHRLSVLLLKRELPKHAVAR